MPPPLFSAYTRCPITITILPTPYGAVALLSFRRYFDSERRHFTAMPDIIFPAFRAFVAAMPSFVEGESDIRYAAA